MSEWDEFLLDVGMQKGKPRGKLLQWGDTEHEGWYYFKFEGTSLMCTAQVALSLGYCEEKDGKIYVREDI